jgi:tetratricopeptide (TPR) repeat protein
LVCLGLIALVGIVFGRAVGFGFVNYDDDRYVYANPQTISGLTSTSVVAAFTQFQVANWHPVTMLSHLVDCQFYGLKPWGHHLTNLLLHGFAAALLFLALHSLTRAIGRSAFVAAVFAIHPLKVESVAWISERKDVLSGVFFCLTIWAYARYATAPRALTVRRYAAVIIFFALGLMSKPSVVTLPLVLLLLDYWPLNRWRQGGPGIGRLFLEKLPLLILSAVSCIVTILAQQEAFTTVEAIPFSQRCASAFVAYVAYLWQTVFPRCLAVLYPYPLNGVAASTAIGAGLLLGAISVLCLLGRRGFPFMLTGWFWFLGMLVPMIGLVQVGSQARADRYTYLPIIGLLLAAVWLAVALTEKWRIPRVVPVAVAAVIIVACGVLSWLQNEYWRNGQTLWTRTIECTSDNYIAHNNLANWFLQHGQPNKAAEQAQTALNIQPNLAEAEGTLGNSYVQLGDRDQAYVHYQAALAIKPGLAEIESNLGNLLLERGEVDQAIEHYRKGVLAAPGYAGLHSNLGNALLEQTRNDEAVTEYRAALKIDPRLPEAHSNLGYALLRSGSAVEAIAEFRSALVLRSNYPEAEYNLARALILSGNHREAAVHLNQALRLRPDFSDAKQMLRSLEESGLTK